MTPESRQPFANRAQARHTKRTESTRPGLGNSAELKVVLGDLRIELDAMRVLVSDRPLDLTLQEFELLVMLAKHAGRPVAQDELALAFWEELTLRHTRHLSVLIARLRTKLADSKCHQVVTLRKRGYGLMPKPSSN
jgi:DNA-binding response OmpR family regulator